jgi:hypothetical protein
LAIFVGHQIAAAPVPDAEIDGSMIDALADKGYKIHFLANQLVELLVDNGGQDPLIYASEMAIIQANLLAMSDLNKVSVYGLCS